MSKYNKKDKKEIVYFINMNIYPRVVSEGRILNLFNNLAYIETNKTLVNVYVEIKNVFNSFEGASKSLEDYKIKKMYKSTHSHICAYCGKKLVREDVTVDHIIAQADGGLTTFENLCIACEKCNKDKDRMKAFTYINCRTKSQYIKENSTRNKSQKICNRLRNGMDNIEYFAKHDSRIWDLQTFKGGNPHRIAKKIGC